VTKVLTEEEKFLLLTTWKAIILIDHNVVDPLLQFFIFFPLKRVQIEDEKMAFVAANKDQFFPHEAAEHSMSTCLFHSLGLEGFRIDHMQLIPLAPREHQHLIAAFVDVGSWRA
jgi:hypothetical protein